MTPDLQWLSDPTVFRVNRLDAHSDHIAYASPQEAQAGQSSLRQSLDGAWRFHWSQSPEERPADFFRPDFDLSGFGEIQVPGHMETQGYGQIHYTNSRYPWDGHAQLLPPEIDWERSPVGCYVREFDLEPGLTGGGVCVSFQGIEQAAYIWCNGAFVGYCEDSFTPSDFDLTPYIREHGNRLCVQVHKRSSAAWLEDQDFFRFSGIFRPVFLYARPRLRDMWIQTDLDGNNGTVRFRLLLEENCHVRAKICHKADGILFDGELNLTRQGEYWFSQQLQFSGIRPWDYGTPELYDVMLTVSDPSGAEYVPYAVGFRRLEMGPDKVMYLNGRRLMLRGVNRHEWSAKAGRAITVADMESAMEIFLANNINAVRTCHYPNRSEWYSLCDKFGIYVMDETNLESHGTWQLEGGIDPSHNVPGSLPQWRDCVLDRAESMFQRDKNHPSVLFWSCGNESFCGSNIVDMANFFRSADPSRLVHYEGVYNTRGVANGRPVSPYWRAEYETVSDMESRMYATPAQIREYLENDPPKPYISCEYMHNMGNSLGGMESYIRLGEEFPMYQGGFIWDFMDQALWHTDSAGNRALGYGGDFLDRPSDYNFSGNGLVTADGQPKPCMQEVRYWYSDTASRRAWDEENAAKAASAAMPVHAADDPLKIVHGDGTWGISSGEFAILFDRTGPASLRFGAEEWLWRPPCPAYWRAPTENDIGCGFPGKSGIWSAAEAYQRCTGREILEENETRFCIRYTFSADILPGLHTQVEYAVAAGGAVDVTLHYFGALNRPELPLMGLRFSTAMPTEEIQWMGLSGETYPDRYKGAKFGIHRETPGISNYLVPQECRNHMLTRYARLTQGESALYLEMLDAPFHFSAIPYTPQQLEQASHIQELPPIHRTVVTVCGAMRGVGGIDSWGRDVEPPYHVASGEDIVFRFRIRCDKRLDGR